MLKLRPDITFMVDWALKTNDPVVPDTLRVCHRQAWTGSRVLLSVSLVPLPSPSLSDPFHWLLIGEEEEDLFHFVQQPFPNEVCVR